MIKVGYIVGFVKWRLDHVSSLPLHVLSNTMEMVPNKKMARKGIS